MNLQEIGELARVSTATVSRIINRAPNVNPVLARRVWRVIEQVGYYPNSHARTLVQGHSRTFGLMVSDSISRFFPEIVQRFADLGVEHSYGILLSSIPQDSHWLNIAARRLIERRVDGVAIITFWRQDSLLDTFGRNNVPVFVVDDDSSGPLPKTDHIDYEHGIRQTVQHLAALGHVRIAFIGGPENVKSAVARKLAFQQCMKEIALSSKLLLEGDDTVEGGTRAMSRMALLRDRPSAVICWNDMTAIGVMRTAFDLNVTIPRDLSVVGVDDIWLAQFTAPPLTTVQISQIEIANAAFSALLNATETQRNASSRGLDKIVTNLVLRSSTALAPDRAEEPARECPPGKPVLQRRGPSALQIIRCE